MVASDAGAYRELIAEGETGTVVPAGDGDALREAIRPYLADPQATVEQGKAGIARVTEHFPLRREADGLAAIYERLWARADR